MLVKVMKYQIHYLDGCGDFRNFQKEMWNIQKQTRTILNKTIQILFNWDYENQKHHDATGEYLDLVKETGYKRIDGHVYNLIKDEFKNMSANNMNATLQAAYKKYKDSRLEVLKGEMSIPSYKKDQPIKINAKNIKIEYLNGDVILNVSVFSNKYQKEKEYSKLRFRISIDDAYQDSIITHILSNEFKIGDSQIVYLQKENKKEWLLYLTYKFEKEIKNTALDPDKILGVDLGEAVAICGSVYGEKRNTFWVDGGEVTEFAKRVEARKKHMQYSAKYGCGGRKGHGTKTMTKKIYKVKNKIANFRDTKNHIYSRALIDFAVKNNCGTIQMEDLSGIKEKTGFPKLLQHWTYYDLQSKIESKAKEQGIKVIKINPKYTSQRCSRCGNIDSNNRKTQEKFICTKCGYKVNADYNASQNIAIKGIDAIINNEIGDTGEVGTA